MEVSSWIGIPNVGSTCSPVLNASHHPLLNTAGIRAWRRMCSVARDYMNIGFRIPSLVFREETESYLHVNVAAENVIQAH